MNAAKDDDLRCGFCRLDAEPQGIPHIIGDILDLGKLVVVGEDHRIAPGLQLLYLFNNFHEWPPR
jgi:hypothetical protein